MAKKFINWKKISLLSKIDAGVSLDDKAHKLGEEYGEFLQALLKYKGANNVSASAGDTKEHLLEELCDVMNVAIDLITYLEFTDAEATQMFDKKLAKWEAKAEKYADKKLVKKLKKLG
jgi:NTP pyrophosphatase (non-canonical NTP hydrolase)